jgi:hypothetical protein
MGVIMNDEPTNKLIDQAREWLEHKGYISLNENEKTRLMAAFAQHVLEQQWVRCDERLPEKAGNYFVTYWAPIPEKLDVCDLFWSDGKWHFRDKMEEGIVLNIIAWCNHPQPFQEKQNKQAQTGGREE